MEEASSAAYELVTKAFRWNEKRNGFAIESYDAIRSLKTSEIELLRGLQREGLLQAIGAFGFIVVQEHEPLFFSRTDIDAVRPVMKEDRELSGYAFMVETGVNGIADGTTEAVFKGNVWQACGYLNSIAEDCDEKTEIISRLGSLQNEQGTKFSLPARNVSAMLNFIAEMVDETFQLWISWKLEADKNMEEAKKEAVRMLTGHAIMLNCLHFMKFLSKGERNAMA